MKPRALLFAVAVAAWAAAWGDVASVRGDEPPTARTDAAWVARHVEAWQPTVAERAFDRIGWAKDLREAQRLGKQHGRPVFLFTYDGASLSGHRC